MRGPIIQAPEVLTFRNLQGLSFRVVSAQRLADNSVIVLVQRYDGGFQTSNAQSLLLMFKDGLLIWEEAQWPVQ